MSFEIKRIRPRERELIRIAGTVDGQEEKIVDGVKNEILTWAAKLTGNRLPSTAWEGLKFECLAGGRTCHGISFNDTSQNLWALRVDNPDLNVAQRIWTTEFVVGYTREFKRPMFSLRLLVSSPEDRLQIQPAVPAVVRKISKQFGVHRGPTKFRFEPWVLKSEDDVESFLYYLVNPNRSVPIFAISLEEEAGRPSFNPIALNKATVGIGTVVVLPPEVSWTITNNFGKQLSIFNGAIRTYMPGFSNGANPYPHKLFIPNREGMDDWERQTLEILCWIAANESLRHLRLGRDVLSFSDVREYCQDRERAALKASGSDYSAQLEAAQIQIDSLKEDLDRAKDESDKWLAEYESADKQVQLLQQQIKIIRYRNQQLIGQIKNRGDDPDSSIILPNSWDQFAEWCDDTLNGRIVLSPRARREVKSPEFNDPKLAAKCLLWLANEYRDSRINGSDQDLRKYISEGIKNDRCGAESFKFEWEGTKYSVEWHIKNGGNTRDPLRCLRIYYLWDESTNQVVIVTMPAHIPTGAT